MKVLAVNDCASVAATLANYTSVLDLIIRRGHHVEEFAKKVLDEGPRAFHAPREGSLAFSRRLRDMAAWGNYDLLHASGWSAVAAYLSGVPYGILFHGSDIRDWKKPTHFMEAPRWSLQRMAIKAARYVVVSTPDLLEATKRHRPDAIHIPNPVDLNQFSPQGEESKNEESQYPFTALSPHRMDKTKGHDMIFGAASKCPWVGVMQVNWGVEPHWSTFKEGAPKNVIFTPLIDHNQMADHYRGADLILGQTLMGAPGMCELEAAACKRPVILYSRHGFPGIKSPPTIETYADAIANLTLNRAYSKTLAERQYQYVLENHEAGKIAEKWREVWTHAVK